ncbi:ABC transporter ATP-binding protein [Nonomuraea sp. MG754425]|uniref:ABC transporter ATP-binding protein n=1 Tax=Nonomuraea sp. MG754425 TaxID=2570319 RepID=UPI001F20BC3A|nr:ABC transporter ATP-binding protein [Nonomuraea sp. MG754425]
MSVLLALLSGLLPVGFILVTARIIDILDGGRGSVTDVTAGAIPALLLALAAFSLQHVLAPFESAVGTLVARRIDDHLSVRFMTAALTRPLAAAERPEALTKASDIRFGFLNDWQTPGLGAAALGPLLARYLQLGSALVVLAMVLSWHVAVLLGIAALILRHGQRSSLDRFSETWEGLAAARRRFLYLEALGTENEFTKEVRSFGLSGWLDERHRRESGDYLSRLWAARRQIYLKPFLGYTLLGLIIAVFAFWTTAGSPDYRHDVLGLAVAIQCLLIPLRFGVHFPECDVPAQLGLVVHRSIREYCAPLAPDATRERTSGPPPEPGLRRPPCVALERVRFGYPGGKQVLKGLDLTLSSGQSTAIVGLNGSGKTTLVKLICGLYAPDAGRIIADGTDLTTLDGHRWRRHIAVMLQDFLRYEMSVRDNVALGRSVRVDGDEIDRDAVDDEVMEALTSAGAEEIVAGLPHGLDTILSPQYTRGVGLSGGQWQRIALARAIFAVRRGASLLIMDEPTSQLDIRSEAAFFDRFLDLTEGLTTLVISHRFSTVRRARHIAVLSGGVIVEKGTHEELRRRKGVYARMFDLQAVRAGAASPAAGEAR